jgi:hypothetical protein
MGDLIVIVEIINPRAECPLGHFCLWIAIAIGGNGCKWQLPWAVSTIYGIEYLWHWL